MSTANPFRRPAQRQYPLVAEAMIDIEDLKYGAPVLTSATDTPGVADVGDANATNIAAGSAGSGSSLSGIAFNVFELPAGAIVVGGDCKVLTVFNSTSSDTFSLGDSGSATRYLSAVNVRSSTARFAVTPTAYQTTSPQKVIGTWTSGGGTPTTGKLHVHLQYIVPGRSFEVQGT